MAISMNSAEKIIKETEQKIKLRDINLQNYIKNVELFYETQPFFYDENKLFWFWQPDLFCYKMVDEIDVMNAIDDNLHLEGATVNSKLKAHYLEAFKRVGRKKKPKEAPAKWVQFKDKAYSVTANEIYEIKPNYFFTNPIPWEIGNSSYTPTMDKLITEWVGEDFVETMYEIIAYCCYRDYPLHIIFCLVGSGRNGKSQFQRLVRKFLGQENVCDTELDDLMNSRFEQFSLFKKLLCSMGETNFGTMTRTSKLKKLSGQDLVTFEKKGVQGFNDVNYAKLMINSNSLPTSMDTSDGFYRRWMIVRFPNEFPEGKDIMKTIPDEEYNNLACKICTMLPKLLDNGKFTKQGSIQQRKANYILSSNPFPLFVDKFCDKVYEGYVEYGQLYAEYIKFLRNNKLRKVSHREFKSALEDEGFYVEKTSKLVDRVNDIRKSSRWIDGIVLNYGKITEFDGKMAKDCDSNDKMTYTIFHSLHEGDEIESRSQKHLSHKNNNNIIVEEKLNQHTEKNNNKKQRLIDFLASHTEIDEEHTTYSDIIPEMLERGELMRTKAGKVRLLE